MTPKEFERYNKIIKPNPCVVSINDFKFKDYKTTIAVANSVSGNVFYHLYTLGDGKFHILLGSLPGWGIRYKNTVLSTTEELTRTEQSHTVIESIDFVFYPEYTLYEFARVMYEKGIVIPFDGYHDHVDNSVNKNDYKLYSRTKDDLKWEV